jgi:hypothetical protein
MGCNLTTKCKVFLYHDADVAVDVCFSRGQATFWLTMIHATGRDVHRGMQATSCKYCMQSGNTTSVLCILRRTVQLPHILFTNIDLLFYDDKDHKGII